MKALAVRATRAQAPFTHDLLVLSKKIGGLELSQSDVDLLDEVNRFNIRARYPDYKLLFYKQCTAAYTARYFKKMKLL